MVPREKRVLKSKGQVKLGVGCSYGQALVGTTTSSGLSLSQTCQSKVPCSSNVVAQLVRSLAKLWEEQFSVKRVDVKEK